MSFSYAIIYENINFIDLRRFYKYDLDNIWKMCFSQVQLFMAHIGHSGEERNARTMHFQSEDR